MSSVAIMLEQNYITYCDIVSAAFRYWGATINCLNFTEKDTITNLSQKAYQLDCDFLVLDINSAEIIDLNKIKDLNHTLKGILVLYKEQHQINKFINKQNKINNIAILRAPIDLINSLEATTSLISKATKTINSISDYQSDSLVFETWQLEHCKPHLSFFDLLYNKGILSLKEKLKLEMAVSEAVTNAVEHGNLQLTSDLKEIESENCQNYFFSLKKERLLDKLYRHKKVIINLQFCSDIITISVEDEGNGFDWKKIKNNLPLLDKELKSYGRGITLLKKTMDEITWENGGRKIIMKKYLKTRKSNGIKI